MATANDIFNVVLEFGAVTTLTIIIRHYVNHKAAFVVLAVCVAGLLWIHRSWLDSFGQEQRILAVSTCILAFALLGLVVGLWVTSPHMVASSGKSLKQRTGDFGTLLYDWVLNWEKVEPSPTIIQDGRHERYNEEQTDRYVEFNKRISRDYQDNFAPKAMALRSEIERCGIDLSKRNWTNPSTVGNLTVAKNIALAFRAIAEELPENDSELKCH